MKNQNSKHDSGMVWIRLLPIVVLFSILPILVVQGAPDWWTNRNVISVDPITSNPRSANDYAAANQGQVKNIAAAAMAEFDANLPGGAGQPVHDMVERWATSGTLANDYATANVGQLKMVAKPFYDRLIALGYMTQYPWTSSSNPVNDYAIVNVGQVKNLFTFDPSKYPKLDGPTFLTVYVNTPYSYALTSANPPTLFSANGLPSGLTLTGTSGLISGTATNIGLYNTTISLVNSSGSNSESILFNVISSGSLAPVINSGTTAAATVGAGFAYQITASNNPTEFSATSLPSGLNVDPFGGLIMGSVSISGTYTIGLGASNGAGSGTSSLKLVVNGVPSGGGAVPVITSTLSASGTIGYAFSYTITASNSATSYTASGLPAGLNFSGSNGVISGTPVESGSFISVIGASNTNGTASAFLQLSISGSSPQITSPLVANGIEGVPFLYEVTSNNNPMGFLTDTSSLPEGLTFDKGSGVLMGTPSGSSSGTYHIVLTATNPVANASGTLELSIAEAYPLILSATTDTATVGVPYSYEIQAANNPTRFTAVPTGTSVFPAGLQFNPVTGVILGTPNTPGNYEIALQAIGSGTGTATLHLAVINNGPPIPTIKNPWIEYKTVNTAINYPILTVNNPSSYSITGSLPPGLALTGSTISGTATSVGTYPMILNAVNASGTAKSDLLLVIESDTSSISSTIILQAGVNPYLSYQTTSAVIAKDTSAGNFAQAALGTTGGIVVGKFTTTRIGRGLIGYDLSMLPYDATGTSAQLNLYLASTTTSGTTEIRLLRSDSLFYPDAASWSSNSGSNSLLGALDVGTTTGSKIFISGSNFLDAIQDALQTNHQLQFMLMDGTAEANTTDSSLNYTFVSETDTQLLKRPKLTINYTTSSPPVILPGQIQIGAANGAAINYTVPIFHGPATFGATGLPSGLSIHSDSGIITGVPTSTGTSTVYVSATNANGVGVIPMTFKIGELPQVSGTLVTTGIYTGSFAYTVPITSGSATYTITGLPDGLTYNASTGVISGTITGGSQNYDVTVKSKNIFGEKTSNLRIKMLPRFNDLKTIHGNQGNSFYYYLSSGSLGNNLTGCVYSATGLPSGLTMGSSSFLIEGVPVNTGTYDVSITGTNTNGSTGAVPLKIIVDPPLQSVVPDQTFIGFVGSEFYQATGSTALINNPVFEPLMARETSSPSLEESTGIRSILFASLPDGLSSGSDGVIIGTPTTTGTLSDTLVINRTFSSNEEPSGHLISGTGTATFIIYPDSHAPVMVWPQSGTVAPFTYYDHSLYAVSPTTHPVTSIAMVSGTLPEGMVFEDLSGGGWGEARIYGSASGTGAYNITIETTNDVGSSTSDFVLDVKYAGGDGAPVIETQPDRTTYQNQLVSYRIAASGSPYIGISGLPAGLSFSGYYINGYPTEFGDFNVTVSATNSAGVDQKGFVLTVVPDAITSDSSLIAYRGLPYSYTFSTVSKIASNMTASNLPPWASIYYAAQKATISGTPTLSGTSYDNIILTATNSSLGDATSGTIAIVVSGITSSGSVNAVVGSPFSYEITTLNSPSGFSTDVELPEGLLLSDTTGIISGTAIAADLVTIPVNATYGSIKTETLPLLLTITANPSDASIAFQHGFLPAASYNVLSAIVSSTSASSTVISGTFLRIGRTGTANVNRGLLAYDISSIPDGAIITSVSLILTTSGTCATGAPLQMEVHEAAASFDPTTVNWNNNGAYKGTIMSFLKMDPASLSGTNVFHGTAAFIQSVQQASQSGMGMLYLNLVAPVAESGTVADYVGFNVNSTDPTKNPKLLVTYTFSGTEAPIITSPSVGTGTANAPFSYTITAVNLPTSFSSTSLPTGLTLNGTTGEISGTVSTVGSTHVTVGAINASGTGTKDVALNIDSGSAVTNLAIQGGNNQVGLPGTFTAQPLIARASGTAGVLTNTLVTFTAKTGEGLLSSTNNTGVTARQTLTVVTDGSGDARAYMILPQNLITTSVTASAGAATPVTFKETSLATLQGSGTGIGAIGFGPTVVPILSIVSGQNQTGPSGTTLPAPVVIKAVDNLGQPLNSVSLSLSSTNATISGSASSGFGSSLGISTDTGGLASIYVRPSGAANSANKIVCSASNAAPIYVMAYVAGTSGTAPAPGGGGTPTLDPENSPLLPPTGINIILATTPSGTTQYLKDRDADPTKIKVTWTLPATGSYDGFIVEQQIRGGQWRQVGTVGATGTFLSQSGLIANQNYQYRVTSTRSTDNGTYRSQPSAPASYLIPIVKYVNFQYAWTGYPDTRTVDYPYTDWDDFSMELQIRNDAANDLTAIFNAGSLWETLAAGYLYKNQDQQHPQGFSREKKLKSKYKLVLNPNRSTDVFYWNEMFYPLIGKNDYDYPADPGAGIPTSAKRFMGYGGAMETGVFEKSTGDNGVYTIEVAEGMSVHDGTGELDGYQKQNSSAKITKTGTSGGVFIGMPYNPDPFTLSERELRATGTEVTASFSDKLTYTLTLSNDQFLLVDTTTKEVITPGQLSHPGHRFVVMAKSTTSPGAEVTVTLTVENENGDLISTDSTKIVFQPVQDYSLPIDEAAGPKYRKIAMNGLPLSDEKPQATDETDQEKEETFVDALTLGLRHSTTDIYLPVAGSDFSVSSRRDFRAEVWNDDNGLRPHEQLDRPFGLCWSSNLAANIHIVQTDNASPSSPDTATVTDESGGVHSFVIWYLDGDPSKTPHFFARPTAKNEQTPNLETLTANLQSNPVTYTFRRKYGTELTFQQIPYRGVIPANRALGSTEKITHTYARLTKAKDRLGNQINYQFSGATNLVPSVITVANQPDTKIQIKQQQVHALFPDSDENLTQPVITDIWDAKGNKTSFKYKILSDEGDVCVLDCVKTPDGAVTHYEYDFDDETDQTPRVATSGPATIYKHAELKKITDPLGHSYQFTYGIDHTKLNYMSNPLLFVGYYPQSGLPRNVASITMPDNDTNTDVATFVNDSKIWVEYAGGKPYLKGQRHIRVTDAMNFVHVYRFEDAEIIPLPLLGERYKVNNFSDTKIVCFKSMSLDYGTGDSFMGTEKYEFDIDASMALKQITDFSGNITTFAHGDSWTNQGDYGLIIGTANINGKYGDPTSQTNAMGGTKTFTYTDDARIMNSVLDEENHLTVYDIDPLQRRTRETIYSGSTSASAKVQETAFEYGNSKYPGLVTRKTVISTDSGVPSLVTQTIPDANGRVASEVVDPDGLHLVTSYTYDANGNKLTATDPRGNTTWFSYDSRNRLTTVTFADGAQKHMYYDARGNKIKETDERDKTTFYDYDALNRVITQTHDLSDDGEKNDRPTDIVTSYTYDNAGSKLSVTDPNGNLTELAYDNMRRLYRTTQHLGSGTDYVTQLIYGTNSGGNGFDSSGFKPTKSIDPRGFVTNVTYDALYRPVVSSIIYDGSAAAATTTEYDGVGNAVKVTDPLGRQTQTLYDAMKRPVKITHPDGNFAETFYTSTGLKWKVRDELWNSGTATAHITEMEYDGAGRPKKVTGSADVNGNRPETRTIYDAAGNVAATINPLGQQWDYSYDVRNRKVQEFQPPVYDAESSTTVRPSMITQYDLAGNVTAIIDARGNKTDKIYDAANRVVDVNAPAVVGPSGTRQPNTHSIYDPNGNVVTLTDANGHSTDNIYDALNRLAESKQVLNEGTRAGITVKNAYDAAGNRIKVTDGKGNTTTFTYDGLNRNTSVTDAGGNTVQYRYDAMNKVQRIDALRHVTNYLYDLRNRLKTISYASTDAVNSTRNYCYDAVGNLTSVTEPGKGTAADVAYSYDGLNRVITETSSGATHSYSYDLAGNRLQTVYGGTGLTIVSTYDALNRLDTMTEGGSHVTSYQYDRNGNIRHKTLPNGDVETQTFDALNRMLVQSAVTGSSAPLYSYTYSYDYGGNVLGIAEDYPSGLSDRTVTNTYDPLNRLLTETAVASSGTVATTYTYDKANNRCKQEIVSSGTTVMSGTYSYNAINQLTAYTTVKESGTYRNSLTYDANGNRAMRVLESGGTDVYSYDYENRLVSLVKGIAVGTGTSSLQTGTYVYTYDYRTRRVGRDESAAAGTVAKLIFSGGSSVREIESGTVTKVEYIRGSDYGGGVGGVLYSIRSGTSSFTHENRRGDVIAKTDSSGSLTYQATYEAFGTRPNESGGTKDRQKANTKDEDPTGLLNEGFRYRDLETGVFIIKDPAGFVDGPNFYTYVLQNPWTGFDPEGLLTQLYITNPKEYERISQIKKNGDGFYKNILIHKWFNKNGEALPIPIASLTYNKDTGKMEEGPSPILVGGGAFVCSTAREAKAMSEWVSLVAGIGVVSHGVGAATMSGGELPLTQLESFAAKITTTSQSGKSLTIRGGDYSISELSSADYLANQGRKVILRPPSGTRAAGGTSDLIVDGKNYDVYTPTTSNADRIVSNIAKKNSQAVGVVLDLRNTKVTQSQLGDVLRRVQGAGATNIKEVIIIGGKE